MLEKTEQFVKQRFAYESSGHDWWHIFRVVQMARLIAIKESADVFICLLSAMLHDVADEKLCKNPYLASNEINDLLISFKLPKKIRHHVMEITQSISFKDGRQQPVHTIEAKIVQDADRLDAIGAIGVARVFTYSGFTQRIIHDPELHPRENMTIEEYRSSNGTAIMHFYEKLFKLKELMNTTYARQLAEKRHHFMEQYLKQFYEEWDGIR